MAKNRKRRADAVRLRQITKILLLACACATVGLGYIWQKKHIYRIGREIKQREIALEDAKRRNMALAAQVAQLRSPAALEERVRTLRLNLTTPQSHQIIRLPEPTASATLTPLPTATPLATVSAREPVPRQASRTLTANRPLHQPFARRQ